MRIIEDTKFRCSNCGAIFPLHLEQCKECGRDAKTVDYSYLKTSFKSKEPSKKKSPDIEKNIHCPECRVEQKNKDAIYCFKCGKDIYPKEFINIKKCPKCDKQYDDSYNFCENDGATLENKTVEVGDDSTMPMKWYKFVTYFQIPLISIIYLILTFISKDVILLSGTIIGTIQIYGFHYKTKWSWRLHILFIVFYSILESIIRFGITGNPIILIVGPILINAIVTYPIYIYFNKRKHLFVN